MSAMDEMMVSRIDIFRFVADRFFAAVPARPTRAMASSQASSPRTIHVTVTMPVDDVTGESASDADSVVK